MAQSWMQKSGSLNAPEEITEHDAKEFLLLFRETVDRAKRNAGTAYAESYCYRKYEYHLTFSFDAKWRPFIGETQSYNRPNQRHYFQFNSLHYPYIFAGIRDALDAEDRDKAGGRVFLSKRGAYYKDEEGQINMLWNWIWPQDIPLKL